MSSRILLYFVLVLVLHTCGFSNDYLKNEQNISSDGFAKSPYVTKFQALSQVLDSLKVADISLDVRFEQDAMEYVASYEHNNTEFLSRKITIATAYNNSSAILLQQLLSLQNRDGGFGELYGFSSTVIDTAFALKALSSTGQHSAITNAVSFLISQQKSDGSWGSDIYLSSIIMHSLWLVRDRAEVRLALEKAQQYLQNKRNSNGLWGNEHLQSAVALIALSPMHSDNTALLQSVDALKQAQLANQSWENDPYTTALVIQAIAVASKPVPNPDLGSISGVVVDGDSGIALSNSSVTLSSIDNNETHYTDSDGAFVFGSLSQGTYSLVIEKENFSGVQTQVVFDGDSIDLGTIRLSRSIGLSSASVKGQVRDLQTQLPIENAKVSINGTSVYTNSLGVYQITNIQPGNIVVAVEAAGYLLSQKTLSVSSGFTLQYSAMLTSIESINTNIEAVAKGVVIDADTSAYLENVEIILSHNGTDVALSTGAGGEFLVGALNGGNYDIVFKKVGYKNVYGTFSVSSTQTIDFGIVELKVDDPNSTNPTTIKGTITDFVTKRPIEGVLISVANTTVLSAEDGSYSIENAPEGVVVVVVSKDGYRSIVVQATLVQGSTLLFSPAMMESAQGSLKMYGTIIDANTSEPLSDINVTIIGSTSATVFTDGAGNYLIEPLLVGEVSLEISKTGYRTIILNTTVGETNIEFSPALYSNDVVVNGKSTISARVLDIGTNEPIQNVVVYIDGVDSGIKSDANGTFVVSEIEETELAMTLKKDQYKDIDLLFAFTQPQHIEVNELKMRQITAEDLRADLVAEMINTSNLLQNPQTLAITGDINITIANRGTVEASAYDVVAFYDINADGNFTKEIDRVLSQHRVGTPLLVNGLDSFILELNSTADFRDQPIYIYIDAKNENIELNEENNLYSTAKSCGGKEGSIDLGICFDYSGSVSRYMHIQKTGLIDALRDSKKFPRDGSIRLMVSTGSLGEKVYLDPTIITKINADEIANRLERLHFVGYDYMGNCLRIMADKWETLENKSNYRAVTLSGDGAWGPYYYQYNQYIEDRNYAVEHGVNVIDAISIGGYTLRNLRGLEAYVYPQPAGGDFGKVYRATTSEDISNSLITTFKKQTEISDLTLGKLEVIDHGVDTNISVTFRVGNAGVAAIPKDINISLYEGDPDSGGILLKSVTLDQNLSSGTFVQMVIDNIALQEGGELYVVGDSGNKLIECTKENNKITTILQATSVLGDIATSTDRSLYGAQEEVVLVATVTNPGRLRYALNAQLQITDTDGLVVESFAVVDLGILSSGETRAISQPWNTSLLLSGNYLLRGILTDSNNNVVDESNTTFAIVSDSSAVELVSLRLLPDKMLYHTTDMMFVDSLVENLSLNTILSSAKLELIAVHNESNVTLFTDTRPISEMAPNTQKSIANTAMLSLAPVGDYRLFGRVVGVDGSTLAEDVVTFEIRSNLSMTFLGDVNASFSVVSVGGEQYCTYSVTNLSATKLSSQSIRQLLISFESAKSSVQDELVLMLDINESKVFKQQVETSALTDNKYACVLQAKKSQQWRSADDVEWVALASASFSVAHPPVAVDDNVTGVVGDVVTVDVLANDIATNPLDLTTVKITEANSSTTVLSVAGEGVWSVDAVTGTIAFAPLATFTLDPTPIGYTVIDDQGLISNIAIVRIDYQQTTVPDNNTTTPDNNTTAPDDGNTTIVVNVPISDTSKALLWLLMLGIGVFYLKRYYAHRRIDK